MLRLYHGNRLEPLAALLIKSLMEHPASPYRREVIVVPSLGVARWLQYRIADIVGVCAQVDFPYPAQFIWQSFGRVLTEVPERSPFDADLMALRLFARLGKLPSHADYAPLEHYLRRTGERGRLDLSLQIARCFDQYLVYRPDWLAAWTENRSSGLPASPTERWQRRLWRHLLDEVRLPDLQHPANAVFSRLAANPAVASQLPQRIRVFGLPSLPPQYASTLARFGSHVEVEWYQINPCRHYWADIVSERAQAQLALAFVDEEPREVGHPLLASWGGQARDHLSVVMAQLEGQPFTEAECFVDPTATHLLARLQSSLLNLGELSQTAQCIDDSDRSIQLHACHSLTRQLEVLHDQLLARFDADASLKPQHVLVMLPNPDLAAPMIEAVFGAAPMERHIAYAVTGAAAADTTPLLRAFATLLDLPRSRFTAAAVFDHLQLPPVAARYDLDAAELEQIRGWLIETGVHWGLDGAHRESLGLPPEPRHTWLDGLMRLLLGYAMPLAGGSLFGGVLPYDDIEGSQSRVLGKLALALNDLVTTQKELSQARPLIAWCDQLLLALGRCLAPTPDDEADEQRLRRALGALREDARRAELSEAIELDVVRRLIETRLQASSPGGVPGGGVTFTGFGPLRGLPYRVICLLGMDDGAFPRASSPAEFDLIATHPRRGDRARRDDDRGSFIDALLAARDVLYIGYTGRSLRDNVELPPSVLVSELLDYLGRYTQGGRDAVSETLLTQHSLQAFDARYFTPGPTQSYAREYLGAADARRRGSSIADIAPLFDHRPLTALPEDESRQITLDRLASFLRSPLRFLLRDRLGVRISEGEAELLPDEPFDLPERQWALRDKLLRHALVGDSAADIADLLAASAEMPAGPWGRQLIESEIRKASAFAQQVLQVRGDVQGPLAFKLRVGEYTVIGSLDGLSEAGRFAATYREIDAHDWLDAWPRHLVLCLLQPPNVALATRILDAKRIHPLAPVEDAEAVLRDLLDYYWQGQQQALSFTPKTAFALLDKPDDYPALEAWRGSERHRGENEEPYARMRYRGLARDLPAGFADEAQRVFGPLNAARAGGA